MPCRWKSQGFSSGEDCISRMTGKVDDPEAFCYGPAEGYKRHSDFDKIYKQFLNYENGHSRYYDWIKALKLDETTSYMTNATNRERFDWTQRHVDLQMWKEDNKAKYWKVEAGFPIESMNTNVYTLEECQEAARTLAHKQVNLNHKHVLPTVEIPAAKFEDGVVEAVLRIPKSLYCPICEKNKTINDLIEEGKIVNVSIEAVCTLQSDDPHKCEGMEFTGLSLLTTASLPGIPLTRLMPLESIMVEALQTSTIKPKGEKRMKIKAVVKEAGTVDVPAETQPNIQPDEEGQCPEGMKLSTLLGKCVPIDMTPEQVPSDALRTRRRADTTQDYPVPDSAKTVMGTPAVTDNYTMKSGPAFGHKGAPTGQESRREFGGTQYSNFEDCVSQNSDKGDPDAYCAEVMRKSHGETLQPDDEMPKPELGDQVQRTKLDPAHTTTLSGEPYMPEGDITMHPTEPHKEKPDEPHTCPDGYHWDIDATGCMPNEPLVEKLPSLEERIARIKAEMKAKSAEEQSLLWQQKHNEVYQQTKMLEGKYLGLNQAFDKLNERSLRAESARKEAEIKYNEQCGLVTDLKHQLDTTTKELNGVTEKYNKLLKTSLELNQKWTKADEDYLDMAKTAEMLKDKLAQARKDAKKIVRIKA